MHPVLFRMGDFPLFTYGVVLALSFVVSVALTLYLGTRRRYDVQFMADVALWTLIIGLLGARLTFVAQNLPHYLANPLLVLNFREGGISIQGALIFGFSTTAWFFLKRGIPVQNGLDIVAGPVLLGMAVGRVGCLLHGCCYGKPAHVAWALTYPASTGLGLVPRHPVQLYEMGLDLLLLAAVLGVFARVRFAGQAFWTMFGGYGCIRFVTEFFREGAVAGPLTPAQWLALLFVAVGALGMAGFLGRPPVVMGDEEGARGPAI